MVWVDLGSSGKVKGRGRSGMGVERRWGRPPPWGKAGWSSSFSIFTAGTEVRPCHLGILHWPSLEWTVPLDEGAVFRRGISPKALTLRASCLQDSQPAGQWVLQLVNRRTVQLAQHKAPLRQWRHKAAPWDFPHAPRGDVETATEKRQIVMKEPARPKRPGQLGCKWGHWAPAPVLY